MGIGRVVLASQSPRRRDLLTMLGHRFEVVAADIDESPLTGEAAADLVRRLAVAKALVVAAQQPLGTLVIGADTTVVVAAGEPRRATTEVGEDDATTIGEDDATTIGEGGEGGRSTDDAKSGRVSDDGVSGRTATEEMLGKPRDVADARRMLRLLSGRTHQVYTAVAVVVAQTAPATCTGATCTDVTFVDLDDDAIDWYVSTGEPIDKAGAYGLQGAGGIFVSAVTGSVSGVLGLPLDVLVSLLARARSAP